MPDETIKQPSIKKIKLAHFSDFHFGPMENKSGIYLRDGIRYRNLKIPILSGLVDLLYIVVANFFNYIISTALGKKSRIHQLEEFKAGSHCAKSFRALEKKMRGGSKTKYDLVVLTGDICTHGCDRVVKYSLARLKNLFKNIENKIAIVPGNHDRFDGFGHAPNNDAFESWSNFTPQWRISNTSNHYTQGRRIKTFDFKAHGVAIICADLSLEKISIGNFFIKYLDAGCITNTIKHELEKQTFIAKKNGLAPIWAFHYPLRESYLKKSNEILELAKSLNVKIILSGHTHKAKYKYEENFDVHQITAGSVLAHKEKDHSFFELEISVDCIELTARPAAILKVSADRGYNVEINRGVNFSKSTPIKIFPQPQAPTYPQDVQNSHPSL